MSARARLARASGLVLLALAAAWPAITACGGGEEREPLTLGYLTDLSGPASEYAHVWRNGADLAIRHINEAGGVHGRDVILVAADTGADPARAVEQARRLIDDEGVDALVGPPSSATTIAVANEVAAPGGVPLVSHTASSPAISGLADGGYVFRTTGSDTAQGVVLASIVEAAGHDRVGVLHRDDAWGRGLADAFGAAHGGEATVASYPPEGLESYAAVLREAAAGGADTLVAIGFAETAAFVREALDAGLFSRFFFTNATRSLALVEHVGAAALEGSLGTAPGHDPGNASTSAWNAAYQRQYGELPASTYARSVYDAVIAIALAAEAARSTEGAAIRDQLARVAGPPGEAFLANAAGVKAALKAVRDGDDVNFEGAATPIDWNADGDITSGFIEVWGYRGGALVTIEVRPFNIE